MASKQGDLELLKDPVAQELLHGPYPAHLTYTWKDGTPRCIPIGFHWNGQEIVVGGPSTAPRNEIIDGEKVAVTIDTYTFPFKVLLIRGTAHTDKMEQVPDEYIKACQQLMGEEVSQAWFASLQPLLPNIPYFVRVKITPEWVGILDFQARFPSAVEKAMKPQKSETA